MTSLSLAAAQQSLRSVGLGWKIERKAVWRSAPGTVLAQNPVALVDAAPGSVVALTVARAPAATGGSVSCPGTPLLGVYHSYRLRVLGTCRWFVGTVVAVRSEADGDRHVDVLPAKGYRGFLDAGDLQSQHGGLLLEIMPGQHLTVPTEGERIAAFGTWVYDTDHGWNEMHPVWAIRTLSTGKLVRSLLPATPQYDPAPPPTTGGGSGSGGGSCDPNYTGYCLTDGIGDWGLCQRPG